MSAESRIHRSRNCVDDARRDPDETRCDLRLQGDACDFEDVRQIAPIDVSVLVTGETGAGKEVIARAIHDHSRRSSMPFRALNCAAVPKDLLESQLFGHRKGAFSGATENHQGIVRAANGGTLLLDEIGELPLDMQANCFAFSK